MKFPLSEEEYDAKIIEVMQQGYQVIQAEDHLMLLRID
jgi:hypothetical protein